LIKVLNSFFCVILEMEFLLSIIVIGIALLGMSIGIIFNRKPLQGSCGGVASNCICLSGGTCDDPSQKPNTINPA
jgi:hypothetical protein